MDDLGCRQRHTSLQGFESLPVQRLFAAASIEPIPPRTLGVVAYRLHCPHIAANAKVPEMSSKLRAQDSVLLCQVHMPVVPTPDPQRLHRLPDFPAGCLLFNHPFAPPRARPVVGKSEKVEGVVPTSDLFARGRFPEREQAAFLWMYGQSVLREAFGQDFHDPFSIFLMLEANDKIISKPHDKTIPAHPWLHLVDEPLIQYMVQEYIGQAR